MMNFTNGATFLGNTTVFSALLLAIANYWLRRLGLIGIRRMIGFIASNSAITHCDE